MAQDDCVREAPSEFEFDRGNEDLCEVGKAPEYFVTITSDGGEHEPIVNRSQSAPGIRPLDIRRQNRDRLKSSRAFCQRIWMRAMACVTSVVYSAATRS